MRLTDDPLLRLVALVCGCPPRSATSAPYRRPRVCTFHICPACCQRMMPPTDQED